MRSKKRRNERRHRPTIPFGAETKRRPVVPRGKSDSHLEAETCQSQTKIGLNTILTSAQGCFVSAEQVLAWRMLPLTASRSVSHDRFETKWTQPESSTEGTSTRLRTASLGSSLTQPAPRFQPPVHPIANRGNFRRGFFFKCHVGDSGRSTTSHGRWCRE